MATEHLIATALWTALATGQPSTCPEELLDPQPGAIEAWVLTIDDGNYQMAGGRIGCVGEVDEENLPELLLALAHFAEIERHRMHALIDRGEGGQAFATIVVRRFPSPADQVCGLISAATETAVDWPEGVHCIQLEGEETARIDYHFSDEQWAALREATRRPECLQGQWPPLNRRDRDAQGHPLF